MTTYFPLVPSRRAAPTFTPVLDGEGYFCLVRWNLFGQRFFLDCYTDNQSDRVFSVPLVESPADVSLSVLQWNAASLRVYAQTVTPHRMVIGSVVKLTIDETKPDGYNGDFDANVTSATNFDYPLGVDPGAAILPGSAGFRVSLCRGFFKSTILFRKGQFEGRP